VPLIFKASYDKANRSSAASFRGPGLDVGLAALALFLGLLVPKPSSPPLPKPNGYDDFLKAGSMLASEPSGLNDLSTAELRTLVAGNADGLRLARAGKQFADAVEPIIEDLFYVASDLEEVDCPADRPKRKTVSDDVSHPRSTCVRFESMCVMPELVRTAQLHINEAQRRVPSPDLGGPGHWNTVPGQAIADSFAGSYLNRTGRENAKSEPGRRQLSEVPGIGKEREDLIERPRYPLLAPQGVKSAQSRLLPQHPRAVLLTNRA